MSKFPSKETVMALQTISTGHARGACSYERSLHQTAAAIGTVDFIDDAGTLFCRWDNGSTLGVAFGEDEIRFYDNTGTADWNSSKP